jgi:hypothetical protein
MSLLSNTDIATRAPGESVHDWLGRMLADKRILVLLVCIFVAAAALLFFSGHISEWFFPSPEMQPTGFAGEVLPGGMATSENFAKLKRGQKRHEVWSILGASSGSEGRHVEWWDQQELSIEVSFEAGKVTDGVMTFKDGKTIELKNRLHHRCRVVSESFICTDFANAKRGIG